MKTKLFAKSILITSLLATILSCSSTNNLTIGVTVPAPAYLPVNIKEVGVIDRTLVTEQNSKIDGLDKILSGEGKNLDKDGANEALQGLFNELKKNQNINEVMLIKDSTLRTPGLGVFPAPLSWNEVERICNENGVNALFALSFYDTDAKVSYSSRQTSVANPLGIKIPAIEHIATINTLIKIGFRIYDPVNKVIRDEIITTQNVVSEGRGINPLKAAEAVINRKQQVMQVSKNAGEDYAYRILPYRIRVNRIYYVRGTNNFKIGKRRARTGDWNGAAELWEQELDNPKRKVAGRAHYNMAIISEINGNLEDAISWASKSYTDYKNRNALRYVNILKNRVAMSNQLEQETKE